MAKYGVGELAVAGPFGAVPLEWHSDLVVGKRDCKLRCLHSSKHTLYARALCVSEMSVRAAMISFSLPLSCLLLPHPQVLPVHQPPLW